MARRLFRGLVLAMARDLPAVNDPQLRLATDDLLLSAMKRQRAQGYRAAAQALLELADEEEREARQAGEVANLIAEADADLVRRSGRRKARAV